jgi:hypothetical protein
MASFEVIQCPSCNHELRVPEDYFGKPVRCPRCQTYFRAPTRQDDGSLSGAEVMETMKREKSAHDSGTSTLVAGLASLLVALTGLFTNGMQCLQIQQDPELYAERTRAQVLDMVEAITAKRGVRESMAMAIGVVVIPVYNAEIEAQVGVNLEPAIESIPKVRMWMLLINFISVAGAISILAKRFYPLGILGTIACMLNFTDCCCMIGLPIGIFALLRILDPEVRATFE